MNSSTTAKESPVRAIMFPVSDSAHHSVRLPQNKKIVELLCQEVLQTQPPSPVSPGNSEKKGFQSKVWKEELALSTWGVVLRHTAGLHSFNLGAGLENFFVLEHDSGSTDKCCFINLLHCQFYLDPWSSDIWLKNSSTSTHTAKEQHTNSKATSIGHGESAPIREGSWDLNLGHGLQFVLKVVSPDAPTSTTRAITTLIPNTKRSRSTRDVPERQDTVVLEDRVVAKAFASRQARGGKKQLDRERKDVQTFGEHLIAATEHVAGEMSSPEKEETLAQHAPLNRLPASNIIGQTLHSTVEKGLRDGTYVAIKLCQRPSIPQAADMWLQEVRMLRLLGQHPNIVQLLGSDATKREIVLSYVPGYSLDKYMDHQKFSTLNEDMCGHIWHGAAKGLDWIHGKGLLYKDLKPANTMYHPEQQRAVLIDFGIAAERIEGYFSAGGTPWYIAPEYQLRERSFLSDIWSLAITLMIGLKLLQYPDDTEVPWSLSKVFGNTVHASRMRQWLGKISQSKLRIPNRHNLLHRMLALDPNERINAKELVTELEERKSLQLLRR